MVTHPRAYDEAAGWLIRQRDPAFAQWEEFTGWLEAEQSNAAAYAELAAREEALAERLQASGAGLEQDNEPVADPRVSRRGFIAGLTALAASAAALFGAFQLFGDRSLYDFTTPPGVQRSVTLAGGTVVRLNGGTRVQFDRDDPRFAQLIDGEALFAVVHDAERPFRVEVGGAELVDLGTRFTVLREGGVTEVAVSEGVVIYNPGREAVRLDAGKMLRAADGEPVVHTASVDTEAVGSWAEGRLVYDNVPLAVVAGDLSRALGISVRADPSVAARQVTAVIQIPEDRAQLAPRLEKLLDLKVRQTNGDWILTSG